MVFFKKYGGEIVVKYLKIKCVRKNMFAFLKTLGENGGRHFRYVGVSFFSLVFFFFVDFCGIVIFLLLLKN